MSALNTFRVPNRSGINFEKTTATEESQVPFSEAFPSERDGTCLEFPWLSTGSLVQFQLGVLHPKKQKWDFQKAEHFNQALGTQDCSCTSGEPP